MVERTLIIDHKTLSYEGLFSVKELYQVVNKWTYDRGYDSREMKNFEHVYPNGKQIEIELWPWRKFTDYTKMFLKIHFLMTNVKEVEIKKGGLKTKMNQGKVIMTINAYHETDYENKWEVKPLFVFLRTLFDKYIFAVHTGKHEQLIIDEVNHLVHVVKGYLNIHRL